MAEAAAPAKGTRPEGAQSEQDASRKVREMFTEIALRYDFLNHLLSFEQDRVWRTRTARRLRPILQRRDARVLDLCCGTGDLAFALARSGPARVTGADFSHAMLVRATTKSKTRARDPKAGSAAPATFLEADALQLPFADSSFDLVTTAFGFRNLANYESGLQEIQRVLRPGGTLAILEFTEPARAGRRSVSLVLPHGPSEDWGIAVREQECVQILAGLRGALLSARRTGFRYVPGRICIGGVSALDAGVRCVPHWS